MIIIMIYEWKQCNRNMILKKCHSLVSLILYIFVIDQRAHNTHTTLHRWWWSNEEPTKYSIVILLPTVKYSEIYFCILPTSPTQSLNVYINIMQLWSGLLNCWRTTRNKWLHWHGLPRIWIVGSCLIKCK